MRRYHAGDTVEDLCRACKIDRLHTVIAADADGRPVRVQCDYCGSQHNYRGHPGVSPAPAPSGQAIDRRPPDPVPPPSLVSDRERRTPPVALSSAGTDDLELLLRRIIREETGLTAAAPAARWRGGTLVLKPGNPTLQDKQWPIETFFHKIVMIRNRLRTLEQQINGMDVPEDVKVRLQAYVTGCYGSLTSFNILFADEADQFRGSGGDA